MSNQTDPQLPPVGEEIHLPGGSWQPLLLTVGVVITLLGATTSVWIAVIGLVFPLAVIVRWIQDTRRDIAALPVHDEHSDDH